MDIQQISLILSVVGAVVGIVPIIVEVIKQYRQRKSENVPNQAAFNKLLSEWEKNLDLQIDGTNLSLTLGEIDDIKRQLETIKIAIANEKGENPERIEKLVNTLKIMSPDVFEIVLRSLQKPLSAISLTSRKIGDSAKIERQ